MVAEVERRRPDIAVLDIGLPHLSGIEACRRIRTRIDPVPGIVIVTARISEADVMLGFDAGADDYVLKPCRPREVVARVRALARRVRPDAQLGRRRATLERGPLSIDLDTRRVTAEDRVITLTATEYALLVELVTEPGVVKSRRQLLADIWEVQNEGYARNVDCHVTRVRRKLELAGASAELIQSVHGVGYVFVGEPSATPRS